LAEVAHPEVAFGRVRVAHRPTQRSAGRLRWIEATLSGTETVAFAWHTLVGFLRITTRSRDARDPWPVERALDVIDGWLAQPVATDNDFSRFAGLRWVDPLHG
jgi:predicted nucleic acid-binding protein